MNGIAAPLLTIVTVAFLTTAFGRCDRKARNPVIASFGHMTWQLDDIEDLGDEKESAMYVIVDRDRYRPGVHVFELLIMNDGDGDLIVLPIADTGEYSRNIHATTQEMLEILQRIAVTRTVEQSNRLGRVKANLRKRLR